MRKINFLIFISFIMLSLFACSSKGGDEVISIWVGSEPQTIDPTLNSATDGIIYTTHIFEGLTSKDKENRIVPGVAEKWSVSADGLTYTFHLRANAKWSDGKAVTANDFVYSWRRAVDPVVASPYSFLMVSIKNASQITAGKLNIEELGVKAIDDKTLEVTLESPTAYFTELTAFPTYFPLREDIVSVNENWTQDPATYIGNGAYKMSERKPDELIAMELNENYWNKATIVAKKLNFVLLSDSNTALAAVTEGSVHYATDPPSAALDYVEKEGLLKVTPLLGVSYWAINNTNAILKDVRVRKALSLAVDRSVITKQIVKGGRKPAGAFIPSGLNDVKGDFRENGGDYINVKDEDFSKNVAEAKKLLAEAGYPDGKGFPVLEFKTNPGTGNLIGEAIQQMWKENLGITLVIALEEWAVFQKSRQTKQFQICRADWIGDYLDPMTFAELFVTGGSGNRIVYSNPEYDRLIEVAKNSTDQKVRMEAMHKAEDLLVGEDYALIPLYYYASAAMVSPRIKGYIVDAMAVRRFHYAYLEKK